MKVQWMHYYKNILKVGKLYNSVDFKLFTISFIKEIAGTKFNLSEVICHIWNSWEKMLPELTWMVWGSYLKF